MKISRLKELLCMFHEDTEVHIQTNPDDYTQPLEMKAIALATIKDERANHQENILVLTAFIPRPKGA